MELVLLLGWFVTGSSYPLQRAEDLFQHRQFQASLSALPANDQTESTQFLRARNYFLMDELKPATDILLSLTQTKPNNSEYFDWLGKVYGRRAETGNPLAAPGWAHKARAAFEESVKLNPANKDALSDLFDYYLSAPGFLGGGVEKAEEIAHRSAGIDPPEALYEQSRIAEKRRDYPAAESFLRRAIDLAPNAPSYKMALARLLGEQERFSDADAIAERALQQHPDRPRMLYSYANLLVKQKRDPQKASQLLERYLHAPLTADDPSPDEARKLLKQVSN